MMVHAVTWEKILVLEVRCNNDQMRNLVTLLQHAGEQDTWGEGVGNCGCAYRRTPAV